MRPKLRAIRHYRPRFLTLVVFFATAATMMLANLTRDESWPDLSFGHKSYGWPFIWHRFVIFDLMQPRTVCWYCGVAPLAADGAIWLAILVASAGGCEWLLRRYRPRLRWRLRTMLFAIALVATFFGWFATARDRASVQDPLIAAIHCQKGKIWVERSGPKWLDLLGADRFRQHIIAVGLGPSSGFGSGLRADDPEDQQLLDQLARLPQLQELYLHIDRMTPRMAAALGSMHQIRKLSISVNGDPLSPDGDTPRQGDRWGQSECLSAISMLSRLECLNLAGLAVDAHLCVCLDRLANLKSLGLQTTENSDPQLCEESLKAIGKMARLEELSLWGITLRAESLTHIAALRNLRYLSLSRFNRVIEHNRQENSLARLPALPRLETVDLSCSDARDDDLARLAVLPRLRSLDLAETRVTGAGLVHMVSLGRLEELAIDGEMVSAAGLKSLCAASRLRALHVSAGSASTNDARVAELPLDDGDVLRVREIDLAALSRALQILKESNPRLVADHGSSIEESGFRWRLAAWLGFGYDSMPDFHQSWLPECEIPLMSPTEKADFHKQGGWARFDAAGWGTETIFFDEANSGPYEWLE